MAYAPGTLLQISGAPAAGQQATIPVGTTADELNALKSKVDNTGWGLTVGTDYTDVAPLVVNNSEAQILNNGLGAGITTYLPANSSGLYNSALNLITPPLEGNYLSLRANFTAESDNSVDIFDIEIRIPTIGTIATQTFTTPRANNQTFSFSVIFDLYTSAAFIANGAQVWANSAAHGSEVTLWDVSYSINLTYSPS